MTNDTIGKTVLGFGAAAVFGLAACKYIDSISEENKTKEHFTKSKPVRRSAARKPAGTSGAPAARKPAARKPVAKRPTPSARKPVARREKFGDTKKIRNKEFLTDTSRFGASTRELLNYRDIRPMPLITPAAEGSIPFGGSGVADVPTNNYGKNIFSLGSGSATTVPGSASSSELLGGATALDGTDTSSLYANV